MALEAPRLQLITKTKTMKTLNSIKPVSISGISILFATAILFSMGSCKKDLVATPEKPATQAPITSTKDLKVNQNFSWSTTGEMVIEITPTHKGLLLIQGPNAEVFCRAYLQSGDLYSTKIAFPSRIDKAFVFFNGQKEELSLHGNGKHVSSLK